jgi:serine-protein kinase ATM
VQPTVWRHIWQITARLISTPATSRAASALLHAILEADIIPYNEVADELNSIVTSAEISGPAFLVDSSLGLMLHILSLRAEKLPNASEPTAKSIIGWLFTKWTPGSPYTLYTCRCASLLTLAS